MNRCYSKTAGLYDKLYAGKDYSRETLDLVKTIRRYRSAGGGRLLDVACGTGLHLELMREYYDAEGMDICPEMLAVARKRLPGVTFHEGDMVDFQLDGYFDVITCLFSSIGYVKTVERLKSAIRCMARHLEPGGLLVLEPWFTPEAWRPNTVHGLFVDEPELKIARVNTSFTVDGVSVFDLHYLVGTPEGTEHIQEHHELGLFTVDEMKRAMLDASLDVHYEEGGFTGRGVYIGIKAAGLS